jgi:cell division transport system permease protein
MRTIRYSFREGWLSLWRSRGSATFAVLAIALAMLVLGTLLLLTSNIQRVVSRWTTAAEFSVYLRDDATSEQRGAIEAAIDQSGVAAAREYVSKGDALVRFRKEFTDLAGVADGFDDNPFPASLEVQVRPETERDGRASQTVTRLLRMPGVADVRYDREWLARVAGALSALRGAGLALVLLMGLAAAVTVASVVRLGLHSRRDELEIMQLVGSPLSFIRGPFVAEGLMQGGVGAIVALALLWVGFAVITGWWGGDLTAMLEGGSVAFLSPVLSASVVGGGMLVGALGGYAASRHAV